MRTRRDISFGEWQQEQARLGKSPARGGIQTPIGSYSPGSGLVQQGRLDTTDRSSGGNRGMPGPWSTAGPSPNSKYTEGRPEGSPDPWVDDIDMGGNFFSPFQPVWPFGPPNITVPREWDYPVGYNLAFIQPRMELMTMLRGMARTWGVLSTIIATRMDQLLRIPWTIQVKGKPHKESGAVKEMRQFFRRPDRKLGYSQWTRKVLYDLLELDAPTIYFARDRLGRPLAAEVINGQTIFPIIDDAGRRPDSVVEMTENGMTYLRRQPAFQQIIKGLPLIDLDESELMYFPMRPRPDMPMFGYPPTEQIYVETSEAVRKTFYQLDFWAEGTIPDLVVTVPDTWSPRQIAMFQAHFDAMLGGNLKLKSKVRFLPGGMKPFDIKNSSGESLWSQRDETLIRLACYAYSVSPAPFVKMTNRATAQNAQQMAEEEGLYPLMSFWKDEVLDSIIQERFGYDDIEAVFLPKPEPDLEKAAKIHDTYVKNGTMTRNEIRAEKGLEPEDGGDVAMIEIGNAVIPVAIAAKGGALPVQGGGGNGKPPANENKDREGSSKANPMRGPAQSEPTSVPVAKATKAEVRAAARQATGDLNDLSHLQLHTGNYPKGHVWIQGLNISIENAKGSLRGEKDQHGKKWSVRMPAPYGYIRGTIGADGDSMDVYIGNRPKSTEVWVIDQNRVSKKGNVKGFDEHKCFIAYKSLKRVLKDYLASHFDGHGHERLGDVFELSMDEFKKWLADGDLKSPIANAKIGTLVLKDGDLRKASDTISTATNISWYDQGAKPSRKRKKKKNSRQGPRWLELRAG